MTPEQVQQELERGPVLLPHPGAAVPLVWDITYERLSAMPGVTSSKNDFGGPTLTLAAVRLCGLVCAEMKVYQYYNREDVPVDFWSASITVVPQWEEQYPTAKEHLDRMLADIAEISGEEGATTSSGPGRSQASESGCMSVPAR